MQTLVGRMRNGPELDEALEELAELKERTTKTSVGGGRAFNPGRNPATDLPAMLTVSTAVALGALQRKESRGGHAREDCPQADREMGKVNVVQGQKAERGPYAPITICPVEDRPRQVETDVEQPRAVSGEAAFDGLVVPGVDPR